MPGVASEAMLSGDQECWSHERSYTGLFYLFGIDMIGC